MDTITPIKLGMHWGGTPPEVGDYLRPDGPLSRTAYFILKVNMKPAPLGALKGPVTCQRLPIDEIPDGAVVHSFRWNARKRRRGR